MDSVGALQSLIDKTGRVGTSRPTLPPVRAIVLADKAARQKRGTTMLGFALRLAVVGFTAGFAVHVGATVATMVIASAVGTKVKALAEKNEA